jgi:hypothetical protein
MDTNKRIYRSPELVEYGRLAQLTRGQVGLKFDVFFGTVTDTPCDPDQPQHPPVQFCTS